MQTMRDRCVNCGIKIRSPRQHVAELEESLQQKLGHYISPVMLSPSHRLCLKCEGSLRAAGAEREPGARLAGHGHVCATCGVSLLSARCQARHFNATYPHYQLLMSWIPAELQGRLHRACRACCSRALRAHNKALSAGAEKPHREESDAPENDEAEQSRSPSDQFDCEENRDVTSLTLAGYSRALPRGEQCSFPGCGGVPCAPAPLPHRQKLLIRHKTYVPSAALLCRPHLDQSEWALLAAAATPNASFTGEHLADMLFLMKNIKPIELSDVEGMDPLLRKHWLGVTGEEWRDKLQKSSLSPLALSLYLAQRKGKECEEVLCSLFQIPRAQVEEALRTARARLGNTADES